MNWGRHDSADRGRRVKTYIPELSETQMVRRAPDRVIDFGPEGEYIFGCAREVERCFKVSAWAGHGVEELTARMLIKQLIEWWRTLEPGDEAQRGAHARLPGAIRLIDTISLCLSERKSTQF